jgi:cation diffusion facilitator CzcD-associated flavoprotein CzcO
VIILANGFQVVKWFHPLTVIGREGKKLDEVFKERGGPQMFMGAAMDSFPNFFALFGPNTATGHSSVILASENVANLSLKFIEPILKGDVTQVEIKKEVEIEWAKDIQRACKQTIWHQGGCTSWYKSESDWNSTVYPYVSELVLLISS